MIETGSMNDALSLLIYTSLNENAEGIAIAEIQTFTTEETENDCRVETHYKSEIAFERKPTLLRVTHYPHNGVPERIDQFSV